MLTWLFSARHWLISNYRFPTAAQQSDPVVFTTLPEDLKTIEHHIQSKNPSMCVCFWTAHIPAVRWLARPHAPQRPPSSAAVSGGSAAARLRLSQGVPLLPMLCGRLYTSQVHHTSPVTSPTGNALVCRDTCWLQRDVTLHRSVYVSNVTCIVSRRSPITCRSTAGGNYGVTAGFSPWLR